MIPVHAVAARNTNSAAEDSLKPATGFLPGVDHKNFKRSCINRNSFAREVSRNALIQLL